MAMRRSPPETMKSFASDILSSETWEQLDRFK